MATLTAIIPAFNRPDLTAAAVAGLRRQSRVPDEIVVVDDGSAVPLSGLPARILRHETNRGFACAVNTGIRASQTSLVAILNNDVTLHPEFLERLATAINYRDVPFACGKLYRPDGRIDGTWNLVVRGGMAWQAGHGRTDSEPFRSGRNVWMCSFTACVVNKNAFDSAGLLDETYGTFYEDVEWGFRAGGQGWFEPEATGVHEGSATARSLGAFPARQLLRNHRRFARQYLLPEYQREYQVARTLLRASVLSRGRWPGVPDEEVALKPRSPVHRRALLEMEQELFSLQKFTGYDTTWQWYERLIR
ncbi:MAG: glycosyltransferase family 2 protein [Acidobacteria bacterium]|nr:glycosyltransferase family 2 protein [Acidobacteriota bacterium]